MVERKKPVDGAIGRRIKDLRVARGMSRLQLARKIGITQRMVTYYEQGWVRMNIERLTQFAIALRCQLVDLITPPEAP